MSSVLSPQSWPFALSLLPRSAHLVGGSVRDALLGRKADYLDLDFVLPCAAVETARAIARHYDAGFVVLDPKNQIARVVFRQATVDFAQQVGESLEADLHRRDFTVNAIAYHPHTELIFDPLGGCADLKRRLLRMIAADNLADDPLRLLRAYRQAAQLGFSLDEQTRITIHQLAPLLGKVAAERVRGELDCLLSKPEGTPLMKLAREDDVLCTWLPALSGEQICQLVAVDQAARYLQEQRPEFAQLLTTWIKEQTPPGFHRSWFKAAKLSRILSPNVAVAEAELTRFKYSRVEQQAVLAILRGWECLQAIATGDNSRRQQYHLFKTADSSFVALVLVGLAEGVPFPILNHLIDRFLDKADPVAHPHPLVSGRDLIRELGIRSGPHIGEMLSAIELAHAEGQIQSSQDALEWIQETSNL
ncbi:CCA tRNA nucleotidyltransferase [Oscillatoria sp. CS-180]|uniref:CCA tRNA nucleotidyltransferase n=1 Tax=Oscillatoria sp. CS-180 TaxID=3021720 RepID=UPI00232F0868|nr:CCA tRNA nucleotidyltransferase [Oscillatoria sp. CS-180]MDB9528381.1 CCA tRNA nucleotidyltransferase [Oscillatoria sp. CS-180]